jgi:HlyD family secretion protein
MKKPVKIIIIIIASILTIAAGVGIYMYWRAKANNSSHFTYTTLKKGDIAYTITATGNLNDSLVIAVGTQVSGIIKEVFVDFNDTVKAGQVIALIDTLPLATEVSNAEATLFKAKTGLKQQEKEFNRYKELLVRNAVNQSDYDLAEASYNAALSVFRSAEADLKRAKTNLSYATIVAPIKGIVISRNVNVGQTVAASFNTPTLFSIGNDPHIMQVTASIDEADIGWVQKGQDVTFTVETYPDRVYTGKVYQVRLQPITNQNVVTYNVMINVYNPDLTLLPGMTANLSIKVIEHKNVLLLPMAALFFNPLAPDTAMPSTDNNKQTVWALCANDSGIAATDKIKCLNVSGVFMRCDTVKKILDDGIMAEVEGEDLKEGQQIAIGIVKEAAKKSKSLLPNTMPQRPRNMPGPR